MYSTIKPSHQLLLIFDDKYYEVKRNGTNRRLLGRKVGWDWNGIYEILAELKEKLGEEISKFAPEGREQNEKNLRCLMMSKFTNEVRTYFQEKS